MWLKTILVFLLLTTSAAAQSGQRGRCVPSPQDDCAGGYWATVKEQCSWMSNLVCKQFESKGELCYGIENLNTCIDGSLAHHFERKIDNRVGTSDWSQATVPDRDHQVIGKLRATIKEQQRKIDAATSGR